MRAAIYTRVSTEDQARDGFGLAVQREACERYANANGYEVTQVYIEGGASGTKGRDKRARLDQLQADAESGAFEAVIFYDITRIARSVIVGLTIVGELIETGVNVVTLDGRIDTSTPDGKMMTTMRLAVAEWQRDIIVKKTTDGREARGRKDGERGGRVPMGYRRIFRDGKAQGVTIAPAEAATVKAIFKMRERGATLQQIADRLNADGELTRRGKPWTPSSLHYVVRNRPKYEGQPRGQSAERWPAILGR